MQNLTGKQFFYPKLWAIVLVLLQLLSVSTTFPSFCADNTNMKEAFVEINSSRLHYVESGQGQAIVLLHGNEGTLQDFTCSIFGRLASKYHAIAFDRPGHGMSQEPIKLKPTPEVQARILHEALLKLGVKRPILLAHSWSGSVALSYALLFPNDVSALVLLAAVAYDNGNKPQISYYAVQLPIIGPIIAYFYKKASGKKVKAQLEAAFAPDSTPRQYEESFLSTLFKTSELKAAAEDEITINRCLRKIGPFYNQIKIPVIIVTGACDKTVSPQKNSYALHRTLSQSQLIIIADSGHELLFTQPDKVLEAVELASKAPTKWEGLSVSKDFSQ